MCIKIICAWMGRFFRLERLWLRLCVKCNNKIRFLFLLICFPVSMQFVLMAFPHSWPELCFSFTWNDCSIHLIPQETHNYFALLSGHLPHTASRTHTLLSSSAHYEVLPITCLCNWEPWLSWLVFWSWSCLILALRSSQYWDPKPVFQLYMREFAMVAFSLLLFFFT